MRAGMPSDFSASYAPTQRLNSLPVPIRITSGGPSLLATT